MNFETTTTGGGLRVISVPLKERRSVAIGIWVHVGGRDESPALNGVSHFLEHIVFKGTSKRTANQIKESVEGVGGSFNAFTAEEYTCFLAKAASRHFEGVFDTLADMVVDASLTEGDVEKERGVIIEEIKMTQDQPAHLVEEYLAEIMWPSHPLGRPLTGTVETVTALTRDAIRSYRDAFYVPPLITVVAAGDIDLKRLTRSAQAAFVSNRVPAARSHVPHTATSAGTRTRMCHKTTEQAHVALGVHTFAKEHADEYALDILSVILGGNMSSRLFNEVREERGLAYDIGSSVRKYQDTGAFVVSAGVDNHKAAEALEVVLHELERAGKANPSADELGRAKEFYLGQMDLGLENTTNCMLWAGEGVVTLGRIRSPQEVAEKVERVTAADVRRVAKNLFSTKAMHLALVGSVDDGLEAKLSRILSR